MRSAGRIRRTLVPAKRRRDAGGGSYCERASSQGKEDLVGCVQEG